MMLAAISPARYGSSEKYSKLRPPSGERFMFAPGPSRTSTFRAMHSSASASPILWIRSTSQVEARQDAVGKQVAGRLSIAIAWTSGTRRTPCGPSDTITSGTPRRSTGVVVQGLAPVQRAAFSSRVILARMDWTFFIGSPFISLFFSRPCRTELVNVWCNLPAAWKAKRETYLIRIEQNLSAENREFG